MDGLDKGDENNTNQSSMIYVLFYSPFKACAKLLMQTNMVALKLVQGFFKYKHEESSTYHRNKL